jgi:hypothetical protein
VSERVERIVCRVTRAEMYECGHVVLGDRAYNPRREFSNVIHLAGRCPGCRKLAAWARLSEPSS